jgi:SpoVK/Ycf46/Vps4 family AAA+-type ATPase
VISAVKDDVGDAMATESFLFETYKRHLESAVEAHEGGKGGDARFHYLMAAKYLLALAEKGDTSFKKMRKEQAERLLAAAERVKKVRPSSGGVGSAGMIPADEDEERADASKWRLEKRPDIRLDDVKGLEDVKSAIRRRIIYPFVHPEVAGRYKKKTGGGVLLYGPPGTGKTMLARAVAGEVEAAFFSVRSSDIMSKWVGDAEKNMRELFEAATSDDRAVVFMDEIEALVSRRGRGSTVMDRLIPEFLSIVDGVEGRKGAVLLLGATNRPWDMDDAALRPGRFDELVYVGPPDVTAREAILRHELEGVPLEDSVDVAALAARLEDFTGADIVGLVQRMTDLPYEREIRTGEKQAVHPDDIEKALAKSRPTVNERMMKRFEKFEGDRV